MTEETKQPTFEENMKKLEEMVAKLEQGGLDLDESIRIYEEAIVIRDQCKRFLEESERKVQKIMESAEGTVKVDLDID